MEIASLRAEAIEYVAAERMAFRQAWMVEIVIRVVGHAELFHHAAGAQVLRNCEGNDAVEAQFLKRVADHSARAFSRKSATPEIECEPPADFNCGHEGRVKIRNREADEPGERDFIWQFDAKGSESVALKMIFSASYQRVRLVG